MSGAAAYVLEGVQVVRGDRVVLDCAALTIARGAVTAIVGANGSGKSTLLRVLGFLLAPTRGRLSFNDGPVDWTPRALTALRRQATYVASSPYLFHGSVRQNVAYPLRARGTGDDAAVDAALAAVGLTDLAARAARTLSSGEAQRVAIARALVAAPRALLFDEPTANVDRAAAPQIEAVIERVRAAGTTVVLATHDLDQAQRLATAVVALEDGCPEPAPAVTILRGRSMHEGDRWVFVSGGLRVEMPGGAVPHAIAIDADAVVVSRAPLASSARNSLSGRITAIERDARGPLLTVDCSGVALRARITAASLADLALAVGTPVWLTFKASSVHVLRDA